MTFFSTLSPLQALHLKMLHEGYRLYSKCIIQINESVEIEQVRLKINDIINAHEQLRTLFTKQNDQYVAEVYQTGAYTFSFNDLSAIGSSQKYIELDAIFTNVSCQDYDPCKDFPLNLVGISLEKEKYALIISLPAIAGDSGSLKNIVSSILSLFNNCLPENSDQKIIQFSIYDQWAKQLLESQNEEATYFWQKFVFPPNLPSLPFRRENYKTEIELEVVCLDIENTVFSSLRECSSKYNVDFYNFILTVFAFLLSKYNDIDELVIGNVINVRKYKELELTIGPLAKTLPIPINIQAHKNFIQIVKDVQKIKDEIIGWEDYFQNYDEENSSAKYKFQAGFEIINIDGGLPANCLINRFFSNINWFDLKLLLLENDGAIKIDLYYNNKLFTTDDIKCLKEHFVILLENILQNPLQLPGAISLHNDYGIQSVLDNAINSNVNFETSVQSVLELFDNHVRTNPNNIAIQCANRSFTYKEVEDKSNQLANYLLIEHNVLPNSIVGLFVGRNEWAIIGILAIMKAGAAYLPIDIHLPILRIEYILNDANVSVLLTESSLMFEISNIYKGEIFAFDIQIDNLPTSSLNPGLLVKSSDLSYVIYTSGTTGLPKGVLISHGSLVNYVMWFLRSYEIGVKDKTILFSSLSFDLCYTSLWGSLCGGGELHLYKDFEYLDPSDLWNELVSAQISYIKLTPSHFRMLLGALNFQDQVKQNQLRLIVIGGESIKADDLSVYFGYRPEVKFVNHYGPTETTIGTIAETISYADFALFRSRPVIGRGISNSTIYILQADNEISPIGISGEICVGGNGLSLGYLNQPLLTAERFIANPYVPGDVLYRTGDIGRWLSDGRIEYLGRKDTQVKIRGYRVELGEIESVLKLHEGVKAAVVDVDQSADQEPLLIGYVVLGFGVSTSEVFPFLQGQLPGYMIPSALIKVDDIPLSGNGKVDMKKLRQEKRLSDHIYEAAVGHEETLLVNIWEEVLLRNQIGVTDNFFELGGHSLKAVQVVSRIYKELEVKIELRDLFENPTIRELTEIIKTAEQVAFEEILPVANREHYEVSHAQKRLWILDQLSESKLAYSRPASYVFEGKLNQVALNNAFRALIDRHESLRTVFVSIEGEVRQIIKDASFFDFKIEIIDLRLNKDKNNEAKILAEKEVFRPFDLEKEILLRVKLIQLEDEYYVFLFTIHHIISDGWSIKVLLQEMLILYDAFVKEKANPLPPLTIHYKDYTAWQNKQLSLDSIKRHREYWWNIFKDNIPVLNLPTDFARPIVKTYNGDLTGIRIDTYLTKRLGEFNKSNGVSLFMTLIASLVVLLYKYTEQDDIVIGSPIAGRDHSDLENQIGFYVNTLALRVKFNQNDTFKDVLLKVKEVTLGAYSHQIYPYDRLVEDLNLERDRSRTPLFDVNLVLQNTDIEYQGNENVVDHIQNVAINSFETEVCSSKYDLLFHCNEEGDGIDINVEFNTDLFKKSTVKRLLEHFRKLINEVLHNKDVEIYNYDILPVDEKKLLDSFGKGKPTSIKNSVVELFEQQVSERSDSIALVCNEEEITYKEIDERATRLANFVADIKPGKASPVGVFLDNSINTIVGILGLLKAGYSFLPLNSDDPIQRIKHIINDANVELLISEKKYIKIVDKFQWECGSLKSWLCLDSLDVFGEQEMQNELMTEELWDYVGASKNDDISVGGWVSSYTGEQLSEEEMDEYSDNILIKLKPYLNSQTKVLEIGCSSGISMFKIAPYVGEYHGTDLSKNILSYTEQEVKARGFTNIKLTHLPAHQIEQVGSGFNIVILNSVIQSFNGYNYFRSVIKNIINLLDDDGIIFLGDIQDLQLKDLLINQLSEFKENNKDKGYKTKTDWSNELFVHKNFIADLSSDFPEIEQIYFSSKLGRIENELTLFRYDCIIKINKRAHLKEQKKTRHKYQYDLGSVLNYPTQHSSSKIELSSPAYVIYTSGSTGRPKGVSVNHKSLANYIYWANKSYFKQAELGNMALITSIAFDLTLTSIFCPLTTGKKLYLSTNQEIDVLLRESLDNIGVDTLKLTPTHILLLNRLPFTYTNLQQVIVGGEKLKKIHVDILRSINPDIVIYNEYGPTENTVGCTMAEISGDYIDIGKPIDNTSIYILDANLKMLPIGCVGEICSSGMCLANGYLNNQQLTEQRFVQNPFMESEKLYKSGDLGRWRDDGQLELLGRNDQQVKIRGFRIELEEIEKIIYTYHLIESCHVIVSTDADDSSILIAYLIPYSTVDVAELRKYLQNRVAEYMIPNYFILLDTFPYTSNGKLDIARLPNPITTEDAENTNYVAPTNQVQKDLAKIWEEVLKKQKIGIKDNFFDLGGHSLKATQTVSRIFKVLNKTISLSNIFSYPTIEELALVITDAENTLYESIKPIDDLEYYDISHSQRLLWVIDQLESNSTAYNVTGSSIFRGELHLENLERTLLTVIDRHESLRTTFKVVDGEPKQKVQSLDSLNFKIDHLDFRNKEEDAAIAVFEEAKTAFNLDHGPLIRVKLLYLDQNKYIFLFSTHHIISDGRSMEILINEILEIYNAYCQGKQPALKPLKLQYRDFVYWQNKQLIDGASAKHREYWLNKFKGKVKPLNLPTDFQRPLKKTYNGNTQSFFLNKQDFDSLNKDNEYTLFMSLLSVFYILLQKYSGQQDIIIGSPIAGRMHKDLEDQIGLYVNTLALRVNIQETCTFNDVLRKVKQTTLDAYNHQIYPFDLLVEELSLERDLSRSPLFDVMVVLQNATDTSSFNTSDLNGVQVENYSSGWTPSKFDLSIYFTELNDGIQAKIVYNTDLFKQNRIELMIQEFKTLLKKLSADKESAIADIQLSSELNGALNNENLNFDFSF